MLLHTLQHQYLMFYPLIKTNQALMFSISHPLILSWLEVLLLAASPGRWMPTQAAVANLKLDHSTVVVVLLSLATF